METLHQKHKDKPFHVLMISSGEQKAAVEAFMKKHNYTVTALPDSDKKVSNEYAVLRHPIKFLINKRGELIGASPGYGEWDSEAMHALVDFLLAD
ncbi:MAG: redoxin domain-containing protein [Nitrospira sp.]|nr:redoxin domain-containing protein [Nitrospira sp.]